jgi:hypothetical protein
MFNKASFIFVVLACLLGAVSCSSTQKKVVSEADREPAASQPMIWDCMVTGSLIGHWEVQISDIDSKFIYQKNLYPGVPSEEIGLENQLGKFVKKKFYYTSDELDLTIFTDKKIDACPIYGADCVEAKLENLKVDAVGPTTTDELKRARWACAPKVH